MLAKVIVHARSRTEAAARLASVLERWRLHGVTTNRDFLVNVLRHEAFLSGDTTTDFIERHAPPRERLVPPEEVQAAALALGLAAQQARRAGAHVLRSAPSGWRNNPSMMQEAHYLHRGTDICTRYVRLRDGRFTYDVDGCQGEARIVRSEGDRIELEIDGVLRSFSVTSDFPCHWVQTAAGEVRLVEAPRFPEPELERVAGGYLAPMPGRIVAVNVKPGQQVSAGEVLIILEAMKMEHRITCVEDGVVKEVRVMEGAQVDAGQVLLVVDAEGSEA